MQELRINWNEWKIYLEEKPMTEQQMTEQEIVEWLYGNLDYWFEQKVFLKGFYPHYEQDVECYFYLICLLTEEEND